MVNGIYLLTIHRCFVLNMSLVKVPEKSTGRALSLWILDEFR